jgi:tight adherence protein C
VIAALAFAAAVLAVLGIGQLVPAVPERARHGARAQAATRPVVLRPLIALGGAAARRVAPGDVQRRIAAAGSPGGLGPRELMASKLGAVVLATPCGALIGAAAPGRLGLLVIVAAPVAGFMAPDLWLARRAAERARVARHQLPELLDLLRVTIDAGVSLTSALATVGRRAEGPLAAEWRAVAREVELGVPLADALAGLEARLPLPEVRTLANALERTRRHGVPLGDTLRVQARDARLALTRAVREEAARAGPKIQLVVALLLVPSVLLLVAAALITALAESGGGDLGGWA